MIIDIGKLQLRLYATIREKRVGICSQKNTFEDKHALLWDFDTTPIQQTISDLRALQLKYKLPAIYILKTSTKSYHAYCFTARTFKEVIHILSDTPTIDFNYLRLGIVRGYYTLRITPRKHDKFKLIRVIASAYPEEINPLDLTYNEYLTSNKGWKGGKTK